jgi:hypothetical protein
VQPRRLGVTLEDVALQDAFVGSRDGFHVMRGGVRGGALGVSMWQEAASQPILQPTGDRIVAANATEE